MSRVLSVTMMWKCETVESFLNIFSVIFLGQMVSHKPFYSFQIEPIQDSHFYVLQLHHFELVNYYKYVSNYENHTF